MIREIVKHYSDFVAYPIRMGVWRKDEKSPDAKVLEDRTLNSMKAIWDRPKARSPRTKYREFYKHISHDWNEPLRTLPVRMEETIEALRPALPCRRRRPSISTAGDEARRAALREARVRDGRVQGSFALEPPLHQRRGRRARSLAQRLARDFAEGSPNQIIRKQLVKKVFASLDEMKREKKDEYLGFWTEFGPVLKEGLIGYDVPDKDKILELLMAGSTKSTTELTSLDDYVARMKEGQDSIYFLTGASKKPCKSRRCSRTSSPKATKSCSSPIPSTSSGSTRRRATRTRRWSPSGRGEDQAGL